MLDSSIITNGTLAAQAQQANNMNMLGELGGAFGKLLLARQINGFMNFAAVPAKPSNDPKPLATLLPAAIVPAACELAPCMVLLAIACAVCVPALPVCAAAFCPMPTKFDKRLYWLVWSALKRL